MKATKRHAVATSSRESFLARFRRKGIIHYLVNLPGCAHLLQRHLGKQYFDASGKTYPYFAHPYNRTWRNERCIELPMILDAIQAANNHGGAILEAGCVLPHYTKSSHDIIDKYEQFPGVSNVDIIDYHPNKRYDLIISISTIEHVGMDEVNEVTGKKCDGPDPHKPVQAILHLKSLLTPGGVLIITIPRGQNLVLDEAMDSGVIPWSNTLYFRRLDWWNRWRECSAGDIQGIKFNGVWPGAAGLTIGYIRETPGC